MSMSLSRNSSNLPSGLAHRNWGAFSSLRPNSSKSVTVNAPEIFVQTLLHSSNAPTWLDLRQFSNCSPFLSSIASGCARLHDHASNATVLPDSEVDQGNASCEPENVARNGHCASPYVVDHICPSVRSRGDASPASHSASSVAGLHGRTPTTHLHASYASPTWRCMCESVPKNPKRQPSAAAQLTYLYRFQNSQHQTVCVDVWWVFWSCQDSVSSSAAIAWHPASDLYVVPPGSTRSL